MKKLIVLVIAGFVLFVLYMQNYDQQLEFDLQCYFNDGYQMKDEILSKKLYLYHISVDDRKKLIYLCENNNTY